MSKARTHGYLLPAEIDPAGRRYVCVPIPDEERHIQAFLGQLDMLAYWWTWDRDALKRGTQVAQVWRDIVAEVRRQLDEGEECGAMFDVRINECNLEKSTDGGATWEIVGDLTACTGINSAQATTLAPGAPATAQIIGGVLQLGIPQGEKGDQGEAGADGADGLTFTSVHVTTLSPGNLATGEVVDNVLELGIPQGEQGLQGATGATGAAGEPGLTGPQGHCPDCGDPGDPTPIKGAEQDACNIAGYLAEELIKKAIGQAIDARENNLQIADALLDIIGGLGIPMVGSATNAISALLHLIAEPELQTWRDARDSSQLWADIGCAIYCAIAGNGFVTTANFPDIVSNIGDVDYPANGNVVPGITSFVDAFGAENMRAMQQIGIYAVYDCSGCDCPDTGWCYEFDFTVSDGGWSVGTEVNYNPRSVYSPDCCWSGVYYSAPNIRYNQIRRAFAASFVTSVKVWVTSPAASGRHSLRDADNSGGAVINPASASADGGLTVYNYFPNKTLSGLWMSYDKGIGSGSGVQCPIVKVRITGTGTNPFGSDNC